MTKILEFYKCHVCGNFVEVVLPGAGELVCCGQPMERMREQTQSEEMLGEKHVPVVSKEGDELTVRVLSLIHI